MNIRPATLSDVPEIVRLLADDPLGAKRENYVLPLPQTYIDAFAQINQDPNHELVVLDIEGEIAGTLQLSFLPYLTYQGGIRAQIEAVRVAENRRNMGLGKVLFEWAIDRAKQRQAHVVQLTTDKTRPDAVIFYEKLGFRASHFGMKLHL